MKIKQVLKYQLRECRNAYLIFFAILLFLVLLGQINGIEMTLAVFVFVVGLCSFSENFHMLMQNGISRKTMFISRIAMVGITGVLMSAANELLVFILRLRGARDASALAFYFAFNESHSFALTFSARLLFPLCLVLAAMMFGYFLAILFYRSGKAGRLCIAAGLPVFTFAILPPLLFFYQDTPVLQGLENFFYVILGFKSGNPFCLIATCAVVFLLFSCFSFLLMRKAPLKH